MAAKDVRIVVLIKAGSQNRPALASTVRYVSILVYHYLIFNRWSFRGKLRSVISLSAINSQYSLQPKPFA